MTPWKQSSGLISSRQNLEALVSFLLRLSRPCQHVPAVSCDAAAAGCVNGCACRRDPRCRVRKGSDMFQHLLACCTSKHRW